MNFLALHVSKNKPVVNWYYSIIVFSYACDFLNCGNYLMISCLVNRVGR